MFRSSAEGLAVGPCLLFFFFSVFFNQMENGEMEKCGREMIMVKIQVIYLECVRIIRVRVATVNEICN